MNTMLTREPSLRRASTIGLLSSMRRPIAAAMRWQMLADVRGVAELHRRQHHLAVAFDEHAVGAVDHDVGDVVVVEQRLERAEAEHVVHQLGRERALLAAVQLHPPLVGDLGQDVLDLLDEPLRG